jgi:hypothetical protein
VLGDIDPAYEPDALLRQAIFDEIADRGGTGGLPAPSRVEADGHHPTGSSLPGFADDIVEGQEEAIRPMDLKRTWTIADEIAYGPGVQYASHPPSTSSLIPFTWVA